MKNEKGITLVEVLATVALLSLVIVMFINLSGYTRLSNQKSDQRTLADLRIEMMLNEMRHRIQQLAEVNTQNLSSAQLITNDSQFNRSESNISYKSEIQPTSSPSFTRACSTESRSTSMSSMVYLADEPAQKTYIITITACWSDLK